MHNYNLSFLYKENFIFVTKDNFVTEKDINSIKSAFEVPNNAVLLAVSYLGEY